MKTTRPFSTISYNTAEFLCRKLDELVQKRILAFYCFVDHYPEDDELKRHKHLLCIPNGQVQTDSLTDLLQELDLTNPLLPPLGVKPWRSSRFDDWYLYASHDTAYLASKAQARKHHYQEADFVSSDSDYMHELICTIDRSKYAKTADFIAAIKRGVTLGEMIEKGQIPAPQFNQWSAMYAWYKQYELDRAGRETHTPVLPGHLQIDKITGEITSAEDLDAATEALVEGEK